MLLRKRLQPAESREEVTFVVSCAETPCAVGKYLVGRSTADTPSLMAVFDDSAGFHRDIALRYGLRPIGGGWCELNHAKKQVRLSSRSTQFGREPNRELVVALFEDAFPGYFCWGED